MSSLQSSLQGAIQGRRGQVERARSVYGRTHRLNGFLDVIGAGEAVTDVAFPVWFNERPSMSFGGELGPNEVLEDGNFPTVSVVVKNWVTEERAGATYYVGATLVVVTTGALTQTMTVHWQAEAVALVNPTLSLGGTDDPI